MKRFQFPFERSAPQRAFTWLAILMIVCTACGTLPATPAANLPAVPVTGATAAATAQPENTATPTLSTAAPASTSTAVPSDTPLPNAGGAAQPGAKAYIGLFKDNAVAVLDTGANKILGTIPIPAGPHGLVITPDGRWVYASSDGDSKVSLIDTQTDQVTQTIEVGKAPHGLALTPDAKLVLAAVFGANQVAFIDTQMNQVVGRVDVPSPHNITISPDGRMAYVASQLANSPSLAILDISKMAQSGSVPLTKVPRALNFSPDGKLLYFTQAGVDAVQVLDPSTNQVNAQIPVGASPHHPLFTANGQMALVVSQGPGTLSILDPKAGTVSKVVTVGKMPHWIATNGTTAWVTNEASNDVSVVDLASGTVTATIPVGNAPRKLVIQPQALPGASTTTPAASGNAVSIAAMAFSSDHLTIKAGQTVTWTNNDSITHTVTSDTGLWDSGDLAPGKSFSFTLTQPGDFPYHCAIHPFMKGTITVTP
jgi:YVTN family beta-propeller protein